MHQAKYKSKRQIAHIFSMCELFDAYGTIAVEGDFKYIKNEPGMNRSPLTTLQEFSKYSPFNFKENCISLDMFTKV